MRRESWCRIRRSATVKWMASQVCTLTADDYMSQQRQLAHQTASYLSVCLCPPELARSRLAPLYSLVSIRSTMSHSSIIHCSPGTQVVHWREQRVHPFNLELSIYSPWWAREETLCLLVLCQDSGLGSSSISPWLLRSAMPCRSFQVLEELLSRVKSSPLFGDHCVRSPAHCYFDCWALIKVETETNVMWCGVLSPKLSG